MEKNIDSKLSKRMLAVTDMVSRFRQQDKVFRVADIGCDHAFVSIYLVQHGIADKVIAMDVNPGPLEAAKKNIERYLLTDSGSGNIIHKSGVMHDESVGEMTDEAIDETIEVRLSDGFAKLNKDETDAAIVAGMGGKLEISIIDAADVFVPGYRLILSPQSDVPEVRLYLLEHGFKLIDEDMICEDGKYYNIICAEFVGTSSLSADDDKADVLNDTKSEDDYGRDIAPHEKQILIKYGENLIRKKDSVFKEYLEKRKRSLGMIYDNLAEPCSQLVVTRREEIKKEMDEIEIILGKLL